MSEAEKQFIFRIDAKVDEIGERVSTIEGKIGEKKPKGFRKTLSEYGGIVALLLSITIGAFTVYDKLLVQPKREIIKQEIEFRGYVSELTDISARISALDWSNPQAASYQTAAWSPQRLALLEKIELLDKEMPSVLRFADHMLISGVYEYFGNTQKALERTELAIQSATDEIQKANAYWAKARITGNSNDLVEMRNSYLLALNEFKSLGMKTWAGSVMQVYVQWISIEILNGTCDTARDAFEFMTEDYNSPDIWPNTKTETRNSFSGMLSQLPKSCGLELN